MLLQSVILLRYFPEIIKVILCSITSHANVYLLKAEDRCFLFTWNCKATVWFNGHVYSRKLVLLPALSLESWGSKTVDGRTRVLCCLLKSNLNFYDTADWPRSKNCTYKRGAHMEVFRNTHRDRQTLTGMQSHTNRKTQIPLHFHNMSLRTHPRTLCLKHLHSLLMSLDLIIFHRASLLTSWQLPHRMLPSSFKRFKV